MSTPWFRRLFYRKAEIERQTKLLARLSKTVNRIDKRQAALDERVKEIMRSRKADRALLDQTREALDRVEQIDRGMDRAVKSLSRWRAKDSRNIAKELKLSKNEARLVQLEVQALLRERFLDTAKLEYPTRLTSRRFHLLSQNEEDGVTWALINEMEQVDRRFVEFGCGMNGGNSGFLAQELGWSGLMVDAADYKAERTGRRFGANVVAVASWVTCENCNSLLEDNGFGNSIDVMSIDIDGNDYWVWERLEVTQPRMMIMEYNSMFGPERAVTIPYAAEFERGAAKEEHGDWAKFYYGASLAALTELAQRKGYRLVVTENEGANAYFLRNDVAPHVPAQTPQAVWGMPDHYNGFLAKKGESVYDFIERAGLALVEVGD